MKRSELSPEQLDRALDAWEGVEPSAALLRSVARVPLDYPRQPRTRSLWEQLRPFALSIAAGALGVGVGLIQDPLQTGYVDATETGAPADDPVAEWEQMAQLAAGEDWAEAWDE